MRGLLIVTQAMDTEHRELGFMTGWVDTLASQVPVTVVCLRRGRDVGVTVPVHSLGRERGIGRLGNMLRFFRLIFFQRKRYDTVLVHMNQIYVLLGAPLWKLMGKRVFLWRNHPKGTLVTRLAVRLADGVFCTSQSSFTARYRKTRIMPVGVDTDVFTPSGAAEPGLVAYIGRVSSIKRVDSILKAFGELRRRGLVFHAVITGDVQRKYGSQLEELANRLGITDAVVWEPGVPLRQLPDRFRRAWVAVNFTPPGSFDKVIVEALACGTPVITTNPDLRGKIDARCLMEHADAQQLADRIALFLALPQAERDDIGRTGREFAVREHSLRVLVERLLASMQP